MNIRFTVFASLLLASCVFAFGCQTASPSPVSGSPKGSVATVVEIDTLIADYAANQVAADDKYLGRELEISGEVLGVSAVGNMTIVSIKGKLNPLVDSNVSPGSAFVMAFMPPKEREATKQLVKGQQATFVGTFSRDLTTLELKPARFK